MKTQQEASTLEERIDVALQPDTAITSADLAALIEEVEAVIAKAGRRPIGRTDPKRVMNELTLQAGNQVPGTQGGGTDALAVMLAQKLKSQ